MAVTMEKQAFKNALIQSFKNLESVGEQIVALINAAKDRVSTDRQAIQDSTLLTAEEKTEWRANYNAKIAEIKTDIENVLP